jgi:hypothetical protein
MYTNYLNFISGILYNNDLSKFKSDENYRAILEHVDQKQGEEYLFYIKNEFNLDDNKIEKFININDNVGNPLKFNIKNFYSSPSNFRYIHQSHLILKYLYDLKIDNIDIVEIGGGYGGLSLAISNFSPDFNIKINNYHIIDLDPVINLQEKYLSYHNLNFKVNFHSANDFGKNINSNNLFLISNYCYSEIDLNLRDKYRQILFPKLKNGFIAWNDLRYIETLSQNQEIIDEYPCTQVGNKFIKF